MISITCKCGNQTTAPESAAGRRGKCAKCGAIVVIPSDDRLPPAVPPSLPPADTFQASPTPLFDPSFSPVMPLAPTPSALAPTGPVRSAGAEFRVAFAPSTLGLIVSWVGVFGCAFFALIFDDSVSSSFGGGHERIHNMGLMLGRLLGFLFSCVLIGVGRFPATARIVRAEAENK